MFKNNRFVFISFFLIGVIIIVFSLFLWNETSAQVDQTEENNISVFVPFYWMILLIGGIIMITLSYVSWRKYKGQKIKEKNRDTNH